MGGKMIDLLTTVFTVVVGLGALLGVLLVLYGLTNVLPRRWRETAQKAREKETREEPRRARPRRDAILR